MFVGLHFVYVCVAFVHGYMFKLCYVLKLIRFQHDEATAARRYSYLQSNSERGRTTIPSFENSEADFDGLPCIHDAGEISTLKTFNVDGFEKIYGLPRKLECKEIPLRKSIESDRLSSVY